MYTADCLSDLHERTQRSLRALLDHCSAFAPEQLARELEGFGFPTVLQQLHHVIGAERYWVGVLNGRMLTDKDEADRVSIEALRAYRERVANTTTLYLGSATAAELNTPRSLTTWGDKQVDLVPARVIVRTQTHAYQHQGQITAMCRLLGTPVPPGLDFPLA